MIKKITLLFIALLIVTGCTPKKDTLPVASDTISTPYQEMSSSTLCFYNKQYIQWKLESQYMRKPLTDTGNILVAPVKLTLYDSVGNIRTKVFSDSGITSPAMDNFTVWGDVLILTKDSMTVRSQKLWWKKKEQRVESNTYVQIKTKKGDILRGKGLTAVEDFSRFSFKSDVKGVFPDFKRRVESNEESFF
ncbi:MAG: LPS export ABC transporter periplasmic protein LptC [Fibrobacter sp.]|nr:LPS export ABC transporter periplasmic protein LptC [Fibrobacter sp.]